MRARVSVKSASTSLMLRIREAARDSAGANVFTALSPARKPGKIRLYCELAQAIESKGICPRMPGEKQKNAPALSPRKYFKNFSNISRGPAICARREFLENELRAAPTPSSPRRPGLFFFRLNKPVSPAALKF